MRTRAPVLVSMLLVPMALAAQQQPVPADDPLLGCYRLELGPWRPELHPMEAPYQTPPDSFRLLAEIGGWPFEQGETIVRPLIPRGRTPSAMWRRRGADSLQVLWGDGYMGVRLDLRASADSLHGAAIAWRDTRIKGPPTAPAVARRVPCPADPE